MKKFLKEFKTFALRGNVVDMAVGIIIGAAFGKIINSLVNDVIMPPIGLLLGGTDFSNLAITLKAATLNAAQEVISPAVCLRYGVFIQVVIDFLILAFCIFLLVKVINKLQNIHKNEEAPAAPAEPKIPEPTKEEGLLTEIRDLLKDRK